jgi:hypothetical protein
MPDPGCSADLNATTAIREIPAQRRRYRQQQTNLSVSSLHSPDGVLPLLPLQPMFPQQLQLPPPHHENILLLDRGDCESQEDGAKTEHQ